MPPGQPGTVPPMRALTPLEAGRTRRPVGRWRLIPGSLDVPPGTLRGGRWRLLCEEAGQGTTEYAILVGVLVLIAIVAVIAFRGRVQELWTSIADGINSL